mgnify:FL=1
MKIFQNKIFVGVGCVVLAAVMAFILLPSVNRSKNGTVKILKLKENISAGTQIDEAMLEEKEVGKYGLPESIVNDKDKVVGKFAACSISSDDLILSSKLSDFAASKKLDGVMNAGKMLVTVSLDSVAAAVGNHLQSGDIVSVIGYADNTVTAYEELKNLEVFSVENDDAQNLDDVENDENAEKIASNITLIVNQAQAEKLVQAEYSGKVHTVFVKRGAAE